AGAVRGRRLQPASERSDGVRKLLHHGSPAPSGRLIPANSIQDDTSAGGPAPGVLSFRVMPPRPAIQLHSSDAKPNKLTNYRAVIVKIPSKYGHNPGKIWKPGRQTEWLPINMPSNRTVSIQRNRRRKQAHVYQEIRQELHSPPMPGEY